MQLHHDDHDDELVINVTTLNLNSDIYAEEKLLKRKQKLQKYQGKTPEEILEMPNHKLNTAMWRVQYTKDTTFHRVNTRFKAKFIKVICRFKELHQ